MYLKLGHIFQRVNGIIDSYLPDEMAIEAPFFGKNVQSMLKLGRAQGVAIAAAYCHYLQMGRPDTGKKGPKSWKEYVNTNPGKVSKRKG